MLLDDTATILAHADFFDVCSDEQRRMLAFASERRHFAAGQQIVGDEEVPTGAFVLVKGRISSRPSELRRAGAYETGVQGSVIAAMALMLARPRPVVVTALTDVETIFVSRATFTKLVQQNPDFADRVATRIKRELGAYLGAVEKIKGRFPRQ